MKIKLGELFAGAGGLSLGALQAKYDGCFIEHEWVTDIDEDSCETIKQIVPPYKVVCADINDVDFKNVPKVHGLAFGFPCNDFSISQGRRPGIKGQYGGMYTHCVRAVSDLNPWFFVAENVKGIDSVEGGETFKHILNELSNAGFYGYDIFTKLYKFEEYGIPQMRHRYIIVGFRKDLKADFKHPEPTGERITVEQAIADIPDDAPNNYGVNHGPKVIERLKYIKPGKNIWTSDVPEHLMLSNSGLRQNDVYRRLRPDRPSYTIIATSGGGKPLFHWKEDRSLTNRERARIQTFPDWYKFHGLKGSVYSQIGMAVPPKGAEIIFTEILKTISKNEEINYGAEPAL